MDIKDFALEWKETYKKRNDRKFWDKRAEEFNNRLDDKYSLKHVEQTIHRLEAKDMLNGDSIVLDIGCGPGKYSIALAKKVKKVVAIDISPKMIYFAQENAKKNSIDNISFYQLSWDDVDLDSLGWSKAFDLVFASMSPGIKDIDTLKTMIAASRNSCFMSGFVKRRDDILDKLYDYFKIKTSKDRGKKIYCAFNILWHLGYFPEIEYINRFHKYLVELEEMADLFLLRSRQNLPRDKVLMYLKNISQDEFVQETMEAKVAYMYWKV